VKRPGTFVFIALIALVWATLPLAAEEKPKPGMGMEEMAAAMAAGAPGEHHEHLAKLVGQWQVRIKMFPPEEDAVPIESRGMVVNTMVMGGRFLQADYKGEFMRQKVLGMGLDGYDSAKKKHVGIWVDDMATALNYFEGECSDDGKVMTMYSTGVDPQSGQAVTFRGVTTIKSTSMFTYEQSMKMGDGEFVSAMQAIYTKI